MITVGRLKRILRQVRWRWLAAAALLILVASGGVYAYLGRPVTRQVNYNPCEINYGQIVNSWRGEGSDAWNERGFYYEARRFELVAETDQDWWWRNVVEATPTLIATGGPEACRPEFDELVDVAGSLRWEGARSQAARLGMPDLAEVNNGGIHGDYEQLEPDTSLTPPVYGRGGGRAAAMVDDGGSAMIVNADGAPHQVWCFGMDDCRPLTDTEPPSRGQGYLFMADNCPAVFAEARTACAQATGWYSQLDLTDLVGRNERGELSPFSLRLSAISTYAPRVSAWTVLVFKYPLTSRIEAELEPSSVKVDPGDKLTVELTLTKTGPDIQSLTIDGNDTQQPLEGAGFSPALGDRQIASLNQAGTITLNTSYAVANDADRSKCYEYKPTLAADGAHEVTVESPAFSYCIKAARQVEHAYTASTLGDTESDSVQFSQQVAETLNHRLGWGSVGITFTATSSGSDFTIYLATPAEVNKASSGCDATYSCRVGNRVYINEKRWQEATASWTNSGGSPRDYRHMVVNHEVGHWLGFGHAGCPQDGSLAPVMQQQSIDLMGCKHNPWPLKNELTALKQRLGL